MTKSRISFIVAALALTVSLAGCLGDTPPTAKNQQAAVAQQAANSIAFTENAEIENIKRRLELTSRVGALGYIVLLNESGQPIYYAAVKGKVTSGSKRLTEPDRTHSNLEKIVVRAAPSDEGTYGSSGEYVFFWTQSGQYIQWNGKYFYSDKPIRLKVEPLVVDVQ